jgi:hypothetical protein
VEIVLRTETPEGVAVVLPAMVYAKVLEEHTAVADLAPIDRTVRTPDARRLMFVRVVSGSSGARAESGLSRWLSSGRYLPSS